MIAAWRIGIGAIEDQAVAVAAVVLRILVGLGDPQARLAAVGRHGTRQLQSRARCSSTVYFSGAPLIRSTTPSSRAGDRRQAGADAIVEHRRAGCRDRDVVDGAERRRFRARADRRARTRPARSAAAGRTRTRQGRARRRSPAVLFSSFPRKCDERGQRKIHHRKGQRRNRQGSAVLLGTEQHQRRASTNQIAEPMLIVFANGPPRVA